MTHTHHDWRGAPIHPGATVIVANITDGRMAQLELTVRALLPEERLEVDLVRHTPNIPGPEQVSEVPARWVTVVNALPVSPRPTAAAERTAETFARLLTLEKRLRALDAGAEPVFVREREITLTRIEKIYAEAAA